MFSGALVGFGEVAEKAHVPAFASSKALRLVAVAEASPGRRERAQRLLPEALVFASLDELLAAKLPIHFVDIATPPHLHCEQSLASLRSALHVLCEKPVALRRSELDMLVSAASDKGRILFGMHNWKYAPIFCKLRELLASDAVGAVRHVEWHVLRTQPAAVAVNTEGNWRTDLRKAGGGILVDHGWHAVYLVASMIGQAAGASNGTLHFTGDTDDEATCLIEFPGATAVVHLTWRAAARGHWGAVYGASGRIEIGDDRLTVECPARPTDSISFGDKLSQGSAHPEWLAGLLPDFAGAMNGGPQSEQAAENAREVETCVAVIENIYRSKAPT